MELNIEILLIWFLIIVCTNFIINVFIKQHQIRNFLNLFFLSLFALIFIFLYDNILFFEIDHKDPVISTLNIYFTCMFIFCTWTIFSRWFSLIRKMTAKEYNYSDHNQNSKYSAKKENPNISKYKINDIISLILEDGKTNIYIKGMKFRQCSFLLLNIENKKTNEIRTIDEAKKYYSDELEGIDNQTIMKKYGIAPETEFEAICSNIQAWVENDYNTDILHSNIAFPLLNKISIYDNRAKMRLKEEILKRFNYGYEPVKHFLIIEGYIDKLNKEEIDSYNLNEKERIELHFYFNHRSAFKKYN